MQPQRILSLSIFLCGAIGFLGSSHVLAAADPAAVCASKQMKCVAKGTKLLLKCHSKAEKAGTVVDAECVAKAEEKFDDASKGCMAKAEAKGGCLITGITAGLASDIDTFVTSDVVPAVDPFYPGAIPGGNLCSSKKKTCVAKKAKSLLNCYAKAAKKSEPVDSNCLAKAMAKFDGGSDPSKGCFEKLETKGGCLTTDDTAALELVVDAFVEAAACTIDTAACPTCPTSAELVSEASPASTSALELGWTGTGRVPRTNDGQTLGVSLSCPGDPMTSCGTCAVTVGCQSGNCRCESDTSILCDEPFLADVDDCSGGTCGYYPGPPLPVVSSGFTMCLTQKLDNEIAGTTDPDTGSWSLDLNERWTAHTGISIVRPCPTCEAGLCNGGDRDGLACTEGATHPTFGPVSLDCPPAAFSNISGAGLRVAGTVTTGAVSFPFVTTCSPPFPPPPAFECACLVCSLDSTRACSTNADCGGSGPCDSLGPAGAQTQPNDCDDLVCNDAGGELGICSLGTDTFCDGLVDSDSGGVLLCATNADCSSFDPICPGADCGDCTLAEARECFLDPIDATGVASPVAPELVAVRCVPPTSSVGVNVVLGLPGPSRTRLDLAATYSD